METITNIASTAATTASKLIYGDTTTAKNETAGKEPVSGEQGKGTVAEPFDKGNEEDTTAAAASLSDAKIEPTHTLEPTGSVKKPEDLLEAYDGASAGSKTTTAKIEPTHTVEPTGSVRKPEDLLEAYDDASGPKTTTVPQTTTTTDKMWKPTDVDALKPSVANPAAGPETGMGSKSDEKSELWRPTETYQGSAPTDTVTDGTVSPMDTTAPSSSIAAVSSNNNLDAYKIDSNADKVSSDKATSDIKKLDSHEPTSKDSNRLAEEKITPTHKHEVRAEAKAEAKAEPHKSKSSASDDDDEKSKMSALKDKLKTKLHIGHKDK